MNANPPRRRAYAGSTRAVASAALLALCAAQVAAQTRPAGPQQTPAATPAPQDAHPPYEPELLRLAEIIGALAYLRDLCGDNDGNKWRAKMADLLSAESASESERQRLAGAYNQGFHGYSLTYRSCTANAQVVIARYLEEGERLTRDVESRFGGG